MQRSAWARDRLGTARCTLQRTAPAVRFFIRFHHPARVQLQQVLTKPRSQRHRSWPNSSQQIHAQIRARSRIELTDGLFESSSTTKAISAAICHSTRSTLLTSEGEVAARARCHADA
jgi:hypothetical protein